MGVNVWRCADWDCLTPVPEDRLFCDEHSKQYKVNRNAKEINLEKVTFSHGVAALDIEGNEIAHRTYRHGVIVCKDLPQELQDGLKQFIQAPTAS